MRLSLLLFALLLLCSSPATLAGKAGKNKNFIIPLPININQASVEVLDLALDGVGAVKAQAIVDYRTSHGPFQKIEDLAKVKGIGKGTLERNRSRISVQ